ncbi:uncharacterized protein LOC132266347 [Cornus florida]|uniref:uncharacterized protein LOC132266347 n=1 Tax=Cornus florida TaxID=4283 RepID=UPI0028A06749|nr:uncharacterized protein LOC132266347 [Cornus florida]
MRTELELALELGPEHGKALRALLFFNQSDRDLILQLPLSVLGGLDCKVWGASKNGQFSVKSAYYIAESLLCKEVSFPLEEECSFDANRGSMWKQVGRLHSHRKIQLFLWQSLYDRVPVNELLWHRQVVDNPLCHICESNVESVHHLLCSASTASDECMGLAIFICIWKCHNDLVFKKKRWDPYEASLLAFHAFQEFQEHARLSRRMFKSPLSISSPTVVLWSRLDFQGFNLNCDAWFCLSRHVCGGGMILRDHDVCPIKVASIFLGHVNKPSMERGWFFERLLFSFGGGFITRSLLKDCKGLSLAWTPRGGNMVAHLLSKHAFKAACGDLEWRIWPSWLLNALLSDYVIILFDI